MTTIKINAVDATNFKGIEYDRLDINGQNLRIAGANGSGKTTRGDAILWTLCNRDLQGSGASDIAKPQMGGQDIHGLTTRVELDLDVDGREVRIAREMSEDWATPRGASDKRLTGHTNQYLINDVPYKAKDFASELERQVASPEILLRLMDPMEFIERLDWKIRRSILVQIAGDVDEGDIIASSPRLKGIREAANGHTLEELKAIASRRKKTVEDERAQVPARIAEVRSLITRIEGDPGGLLVARQQRLTHLQEQRASLSAGGRIADLTTELRKAEADEAVLRRKLTEARAVDTSALSRQLGEARLKGKTEAATYDGIERELSNVRANLVAARTALTEEKSRQFTDSGRCPTCGQDVPTSGDAKERFNLDKADRLAKIIAGGKALKSRETELSEKLEWAKSTLDRTLTLVEKISGQIEDAHAKASAPINPMTDPDYRKVRANISDIVSKLDKAQSESGAQVADIDAQISKAQVAVSESQTAIHSLSMNAQYESRIESLMAQEKTLAQEHEQCCRNLAMCQEYDKLRCATLESRINDKFSFCTFKLFDQLIDGTKEVCQVLVDGLPPSHGQLLRAGIEATTILASFYGVTAPLLIDNAESLSEIPWTEAQTISMYVTKEPTLTIVGEGESNL